MGNGKMTIKAAKHGKKTESLWSLKRIGLKTEKNKMEKAKFKDKKVKLKNNPRRG